MLDGFPRTVAQARALDEIMAERGSGPLIIVDVVVPEQELVRRLATRRICSKCGANADPSATRRHARSAAASWCSGRDDNEGVVLERLKVYTTSTEAAAGVLPRAADVPRGERRAGAGAGRGSELDTMIDDAAVAGR